MATRPGLTITATLPLLTALGTWPQLPGHRAARKMVASAASRTLPTPAPEMQSAPDLTPALDAPHV